MVVLFAHVLSPDVLNGQVFFNFDELCGDRGNKFYEFSQVRDHLVAVQSILVVGQIRQVKKIMTYKMSWMQHYYYGPMGRLLLYFQQQNQQARSNPQIEAAYVIS